MDQEIVCWPRSLAHLLCVSQVTAFVIYDEGESPYLAQNLLLNRTNSSAPFDPNLLRFEPFLHLTQCQLLRSDADFQMSNMKYTINGYLDPDSLD